MVASTRTSFAVGSGGRSRAESDHPGSGGKQGGSGGRSRQESKPFGWNPFAK